MLYKTVAEITAALQELRTTVAQNMGKRRIEEQKMKEIEADMLGMTNIIKEKEAGIRQKEVEIQKFRQMIMETKSLLPRKENDLKKMRDAYAQAKRESEANQQKISELQRELEEAQRIHRPGEGGPEQHHFS